MPDYELRMGDIPELQLAVTERRPAWGARAWIGLLLCHRDTPGRWRPQGKRKEEGFSKLLSLELRSVRFAYQCVNLT